MSFEGVEGTGLRWHTGRGQGQDVYLGHQGSSHGFGQRATFFPAYSPSLTGP